MWSPPALLTRRVRRTCHAVKNSRTVATTCATTATTGEAISTNAAGAASTTGEAATTRPSHAVLRLSANAAIARPACSTRRRARPPRCAAEGGRPRTTDVDAAATTVMAVDTG